MARSYIYVQFISMNYSLDSRARFAFRGGTSIWAQIYSLTVHL